MISILPFVVFTSIAALHMYTIFLKPFRVFEFLLSPKAYVCVCVYCYCIYTYIYSYISEIRRAANTCQAMRGYLAERRKTNCSRRDLFVLAAEPREKEREREDLNTVVVV